jgi:hypothetical protein
MSQTARTTIAVIGIDIGKNSFHVIGHDERGAIALRQRWSRGQVETRLANMRSCLIGMPAGRAVLPSWSPAQRAATQDPGIRNPSREI